TTVASGHATLATKRTLLLTWAGLPPAGSHQLCLAHSFDHLVGNGEQFWRHVDAERSRRLKIDDELEFGRLQHRKVGGLRAFEDAAGIDDDLAKRVRDIGSVAHQPAGRDMVRVRKSCRNSGARRQGGKLHGAANEEYGGSDKEGIGALACNTVKGGIDLADRRGVKDHL